MDTYRQSRQGLDEMYSDVWKQLKEEKKIRLVRKLIYRRENERSRTVYIKVALQI